MTLITDYELPYSLLGKIVDKLKGCKDMENALDYYMKKAKELLEKEQKHTNEPGLPRAEKR